MANLDNKVEEAIMDCIDNASKLDGDERAQEIENATKLYRARTDILKIQAELDKQDSINEIEKSNKEAEIKSDRKELYWKIGIGILQTALSIASYHVLTTRFMQFEQTGHIPTSPMFRQFMREIRHK